MRRAGTEENADLLHSTHTNIQVSNTLPRGASVLILTYVIHSHVCQATAFGWRPSHSRITVNLNGDTQAREASLAEVRQLGLQSDFQSEVGERLKWLDAEQEREMAKLRQLQKQNLVEEARLADTVRDVVGREVSKGGVLLCIVIPPRLSTSFVL